MGGIDGLWGGARAPCSLWASCQLLLPNSFHHCDQCENISRFENGLKIHMSPLMLGLVQSGIVIFDLWTRKSIISIFLFAFDCQQGINTIQASALAQWTVNLNYWTTRFTMIGQQCLLHFEHFATTQRGVDTGQLDTGNHNLQEPIIGQIKIDDWLIDYSSLVR